MSRRVIFDDGAGIVEADMDSLNLLSDQSMAHVLDALFWIVADITPDEIRNMAMLPAGWGVTPPRTISLGRSFWAQTWKGVNGSDPLVDEPRLIVAVKDSFSATLDTASGSNWRRDIVQARITEADISITRDFEDAITRAKSSQTLDYRTVATVEMQVKKGTEYATEALADANEPTSDSGWSKIASFLVDDTDTVDAAKNKRYHESMTEHRWIDERRDIMASMGRPRLEPNWNFQGVWIKDSVATNNDFWVNLPLRPGDRLWELDLRVLAASGTFQAQLAETDLTTGVTALVGSVVNFTPSGFGTLAMTEADFGTGRTRDSTTRLHVYILFPNGIQATFVDGEALVAGS